MPSLKQLAVLTIQKGINLKILEESVDKPEEYVQSGISINL